MANKDVRNTFVVYEIETTSGLQLIATSHTSDQVPPPGVVSTLGHIHGVKTEADAVRVARQVSEICNRLGHKAKPIPVNTTI